MHNPLISIVVPVYNSSFYLTRCIESVLKQSFLDFELLLIDDGSNDSSFSICQSYEKKYPEKIRAYTKNNTGASDSRSYGVAKSLGEWICFVDSDDAIPSNSLELLRSLSISSGADIILGLWCKILPNGKKVQRKLCVSGILNNEEYINALLSLRCYAGPVGKLFKKSLFDDNTFNIDKSINHNEDLLMNIHLALNANSIAIFPRAEVYWYYSNENSVTSQLQQISMWDKVLFELDKSLGCEYRKLIDTYMAIVIYKGFSDGLIKSYKPSMFYNRMQKDLHLFSILNGFYYYAMYFRTMSKKYKFIVLFNRIIRFVKQQFIIIKIYGIKR